MIRPPCSTWCFLLALLIPACAGQVPPPGGPEDKVPPAIVRTQPDTNAVNVSTTEILLEFSEYVDRRSVEDAVFVSPYPGGLEFDWSGTEVAVIPKEPLQPNRTYVISVGTDVVDRRGKNRMAGGFTLAFSTGDSIDRGSMSGRVVDPKPEGVLIFAYLLEGRDPDTLNPASLRPDYVMQTGVNGAFSLTNLAMGRYRVIAVRDQFRDYLYQQETDEFGVLPADLRLTPEVPAVGPLLFRLSREDTTRPFLTYAAAVAPRTLNVRFSEPVDSFSILQAEFRVSDTTGGNTIPAAGPFALDRATGTSGVLITSAPLEEDVAYRLYVNNIRDRAGNLAETLWTDCIPGGEPDTLPPGFFIGGKRDSLRNLRRDAPIAILFSEPVIQEKAASGVSLQDSAGRAVDFAFRWLTGAEGEIRPLRPLQEGARYQVLIAGNPVEDYYGNRRGDSTFTLTAITLDPRQTGFADGRISDLRNDATGEVHVSARGLGAPAGRDATLVLGGPGPFRLERLPEGTYGITAFRDGDSSGTFSPGRPFPWAGAERFAVFPDTVKIRARWSVEGVDLILR
jgi:hypothetical protein